MSGLKERNRDREKLSGAKERWDNIVLLEEHVLVGVSEGIQLKNSLVLISIAEGNSEGKRRERMECKTF